MSSILHLLAGCILSAFLLYCFFWHVVSAVLWWRLKITTVFLESYRDMCKLNRFLLLEVSGSVIVVSKLRIRFNKHYPWIKITIFDAIVNKMNCNGDSTRRGGIWNFLKILCTFAVVEFERITWIPKQNNQRLVKIYRFKKIILNGINRKLYDDGIELSWLFEGLTLHLHTSYWPAESLQEPVRLETTSHLHVTCRKDIFGRYEMTDMIFDTSHTRIHINTGSMDALLNILSTEQNGKQNRLFINVKNINIRCDNVKIEYPATTANRLRITVDHSSNGICRDTFFKQGLDADLINQPSLLVDLKIGSFTGPNDLSCKNLNASFQMAAVNQVRIYVEQFNWNIVSSKLRFLRWLYVEGQRFMHSKKKRLQAPFSFDMVVSAGNVYYIKHSITMSLEFEKCKTIYTSVGNHSYSLETRDSTGPVVTLVSLHSQLLCGDFEYHLKMDLITVKFDSVKAKNDKSLIAFTGLPSRVLHNCSLNRTCTKPLNVYIDACCKTSEGWIIHTNGATILMKIKDVSCYAFNNDSFFINIVVAEMDYSHTRLFSKRDVITSCTKIFQAKHVFIRKLSYKKIKFETNNSVTARWTLAMENVIRLVGQSKRSIWEFSRSFASSLMLLSSSHQQQQGVMSAFVGPPKLDFDISLNNTVNAIIDLSEEKSLKLIAEDFTIVSQLAQTRATCKSVKLLAEGNDLINLKDLTVCYKLPYNSQLSSFQSSPGDASKPAFPCLTIDVNAVRITFPYMFCFRDIWDQLLSIKLWRQSYCHKKSIWKDVKISAQEFNLSFEDDPFEVKLAENWILMADEANESLDRLNYMKSSLEAKRACKVITGDEESTAYSMLYVKNSEIYIKRSRQMYNSSVRKRDFFHWQMKNFQLSILVDSDLSHHWQTINFIDNVDHGCLFGIIGSSKILALCCRHIELKMSTAQLGFRDFPQPLLTIVDGHVWGKFAHMKIADAKHFPNTIRKVSLKMGGRWDEDSVERNATPRKYFYDFSTEVGKFQLASGPCWESSVAQLSICVRSVLLGNRDPSPRLLWWDFIRFHFRGRWNLVAKQASWIYHVSLDPYCTSDQMEWVAQSLYADWTNAKLVFRGDLGLKSRMKSKYDDCYVTNLHNVKLCIFLRWFCDSGRVDDHFGINLWSPDNLHNCTCCNGLAANHDSYKMFRSRHLDAVLHLDCNQRSGNYFNSSCSLYASTLRFLSRVLKFVMSVARPIRAGALFGTERKRKTLLSRHIKNIELSVKFPVFEFNYRNSFASRTHVEAECQNLNLHCNYRFDLVEWKGPLQRRTKAKWTPLQITLTVGSCRVMLLTVKPPEINSADEATQHHRMTDTQRRFFLSLQCLVYQMKAKEISTANLTNTPRQRLEMNDLKVLWNFANRDAVIVLFDTYNRNKVIRKCLQSRVLIDDYPQVQSSPTSNYLNGETEQQRKSSRHGTGNSTSPNVLNITSNGKKMTQHTSLAQSLERIRLDSERSAIVFADEVDAVAYKLHGEDMCTRNDVTDLNLQIVLKDSQIVLYCEASDDGQMVLTFSLAKLTQSGHLPVLRGDQLLSKVSWQGSVNSVQYFGDLSRPMDATHDMIAWIPQNLIAPDHSSLYAKTGEILILKSQHEHIQPRHLLTVIERCSCDLYMVFFDGLVDNEENLDVLDVLSEVSCIDDLERVPDVVDAVDTITIAHHCLRVHTNSDVYNMISDIVNNLLLYMRPKRKGFDERLRIVMEAQLCGNKDNRFFNKVLKLKQQVREKLADVRRCERDIFYLNQSMIDKSPNKCHCLHVSSNLEGQYEKNKRQLHKLGDRLCLYLAVIKQLRIINKISKICSSEREGNQVEPCRIFEIYGKSAQWDLARDEFTQTPFATLELRNILYQKVFYNDGMDEHTIAIGQCIILDRMSYQQHGNNTSTKVLFPLYPKQTQMIRIYCKEALPVGGISVKEHFEVNISPLGIHLTQQFFQEVMSFFFFTRTGGRKNNGNVTHLLKTDHGEDSDSEPLFTHRESTLHIDSSALYEMSQRAARNNMFCYVKIPEVPLKISFKATNRKKLLDLNEKTLIFPTLEYKNKTWTWHDLVMAVKNDVKKVLLAQAIKQKLGIVQWNRRNHKPYQSMRGKQSDNGEDKHEKLTPADSLQHMSCFASAPELNCEQPSGSTSSQLGDDLKMKMMIGTKLFDAADQPMASGESKQKSFACFMSKR